MLFCERIENINISLKNKKVRVRGLGGNNF